MREKKIPVSKSPQYTDARHSAVLCCHYVDIAVADVYSISAADSELSQSLVYGVWSGLLANVLTLSDGYGDISAEEVLTERLGSSIELVAYDSHVETGSM